MAGNVALFRNRLIISPVIISGRQLRDLKQSPPSDTQARQSKSLFFGKKVNNYCSNKEAVFTQAASQFREVFRNECGQRSYRV